MGLLKCGAEGKREVGIESCQQSNIKNTSEINVSQCPV
jgi:hypothetical protein